MTTTKKYRAANSSSKMLNLLSLFVHVEGSHFAGTPWDQSKLSSLGRRLPAEWLAVFNEDRPVYVIWSYGTPIAWVNRNGSVKIPAVKYSQSTTRHQGIAALALTGDRYVRTEINESL